MSLAGGLAPPRIDQLIAASSGIPPAPAPGQYRRIIVGGPGPGSGIFLYNGTPGPTTLVAALVPPSTTTDPFDTPIIPEFGIYGSGGNKIVLGVSAGIAAESFYTGTASEFLNSSLLAGATGVGGAAEQQNISLFGPENTVSNDRAIIELVSSPNNQANAATGFLIYQNATGGQAQLVDWGGLGVSRSSIAGLNGGIPLSRMDFFTRTANTVSVTALTTAYPLPANDASTPGGQQTTYELTAGFTAVQANPAVNSTFSLVMYGVNVYTSITTPFAQAGHAFNGFLWANCMISQNSTTASFIVFGLFVFTDQVAGTQFIEPIVGGATVNNTVAGTMQMVWQWASVVGAPSISCPGSIFTRRGV